METLVSKVARSLSSHYRPEQLMHHDEARSLIGKQRSESYRTVWDE